MFSRICTLLMPYKGPICPLSASPVPQLFDSELIVLGRVREEWTSLAASAQLGEPLHTHYSNFAQWEKSEAVKVSLATELCHLAGAVA